MFLFIISPLIPQIFSPRISADSKINKTKLELVQICEIRGKVYSWQTLVYLELIKITCISKIRLLDLQFRINLS